jgi:CheY-like chemotaxis protein
MKPTVLIVEDDQDVREYYELVLTGLDIDIFSAKNGKEALDLWDSGQQVDLILLDVIMPVMDGVEFLKALRNERKSQVPVVPCTIDERTLEKLYAVEKFDKQFVKVQGGHVLIEIVKDKLGL